MKQIYNVAVNQKEQLPFCRASLFPSAFHIGILEKTSTDNLGIFITYNLG